MYIPKPALEDCLTSEISASGGDVMYDYITGSQIRRVHYFGNTTGSHMFEIYEGCTDSTQLFLAGGGGAGGFGEDQPNGSGAPYFLGPPSSFIGCLNTTTQTAGGGGAGGVLFINPNRELTGSLELVPGRWPIYVGDGGAVSASSGEDTTLRYAFRLANDADIPSGSLSQSRYDYDSVIIKGGGGGHGGYIEWETTLAASCGIAAGVPHWQQFQRNAGDGGSGGGAANTFCGDGVLYIGDSGSIDFPFRNQGHEGIWYYSPSVTSPTVLSGNGGGGYSGSTSFPQGQQTNGGNPRYESIRGYQQFYGVGGNAQDSDACGTAGVTEPGDARDLFNVVYDSGSQMPYYKGSGGQAFVQEFTSSMTTTFQEDYFKGVSGEAVITYALTGSQLTNGKLTYIDGGATGGIFTFVPCGEVRLETITVPAGKQACVCAMDTGQGLYRGGDYNEKWYEFVDLQHPTASDYDWKPEKMLDQMPSGSGTVTFTTGSDCNAYVPFEGWDTCSFCQNNQPAGIYIGFDISGSSGRTNPLPYYKFPDTTVHYTSSQNYITSSRYNNHDSESYFNTRIGAISNDFDDDVPYSNFVPSASFSTSYDNQNVDFKTGSECYTYYDCDPLDPRPITASGGEEGTFISGSGLGIGQEFIYKYHIFHPSGSNTLGPFPYNRDFQSFTITGGYGANLQMYAAGAGGPGGRATSSGTSIFGGGGGAGQIFFAPTKDLCTEISMSISPGFGMPYGVGHDWSYTLGNTIVSASNFAFNALGGGQGADADQSPGELAAQYRSGSGGGGAGILSGVSSHWAGGEVNPPFLQSEGGNGWSGSVAQATGSAAGGGGYVTNGVDGTSGVSAVGGKGGDGIRLNLTGTLKYYGGGGGAYGPGGPGNGGLGGTPASLNGIVTGSLGAGGGATNNTSSYTANWGTEYTLGGRGGDGVVIIAYNWKPNTSPTGFITYRGLAQYYDMYSLDSYDGTGSLVYNLWKNDNTASLENITGWRYDDDNIDSGSLIVTQSSVSPFVEPDTEQSGELTAMTVWEVNDPVYDNNGLYPILADEQFGTSSFGMYAGNDTLYGEAVLVKIGDTLVPTQSGSAAEFIPRGGFHISQFSYNENSGEVLWYVDGYSGSAVINETISDKAPLLSFNSSSAVFNPDTNPVYPSASQATEFTIEKTGSQDVTYQFKFPQTEQVQSLTIEDGAIDTHIIASTTTPVITSGTGSIGSGSAVDYYPSASLYLGRTATYDFDRSYYGNGVRPIHMWYSTTTCEWIAQPAGTGDLAGSITLNNIAQNSFINYTNDTNVTQSFVELNDCIERPPVGLGNDSVYNITAIYTASLNIEEMRHNDNFLYPRY